MTGVERGAVSADAIEVGSEHWLARAPAELGNRVPRVIYEQRVADSYREDGWRVEGPFVPATSRGAVSADALSDLREALRLAEAGESWLGTAQAVRRALTILDEEGATDAR